MLQKLQMIQQLKWLTRAVLPWIPLHLDYFLMFFQYSFNLEFIDENMTENVQYCLSSNAKTPDLNELDEVRPNSSESFHILDQSCHQTEKPVTIFWAEVEILYLASIHQSVFLMGMYTPDRKVDSSPNRCPSMLAYSLLQLLLRCLQWSEDVTITLNYKAYFQAMVRFGSVNQTTTEGSCNINLPCKYEFSFT